MEFTDQFGNLFKSVPQTENHLMLEIGDGEYYTRVFLDEAALIDLKVEIDAVLKREEE